jgi:hypothetical protein
MRYETLELKDLPKGVIAIVGENESGKSTIGEAIAFAVFGRAIRTEGTDPTQAIHWDADECTTAIEIETPRNGRYRIERRVTRTGDFEARLKDADGALLADGPREVAAALSRLLGYDFSAFRYSFYVAQGELDLLQRDGRDNASRVVCDMLGISTIERAVLPLEAKQAELRERASMLDRDLIVASALHTEALPIRNEIATYEQVLADAKRSQQSAEAEATRATGAYARWDKASRAHQARARALTRLEGALVADAGKARLLEARGELANLAAQAEALAKKGLAALSLDEGPRQSAKHALEQAEAVHSKAQRLEALVEHRRGELSRELASAGKDTLPARRERETTALAREAKSTTWRTVFATISLLLGLSGAGVSGAFFFPKDAPLLAAPPTTIQSPRTGIRFESVTRKKASVVFGVAGGGFLLVALFGFMGRSRAKTRRGVATEEGSRLDALLEAHRGELAACEAFGAGSMSALSQAVSGIADEQVKTAYDELVEAAGSLISSDSSPQDLVAEARKRDAALEETRRLAEPRLAEARRVSGLASKALAEVEKGLEVGYPDGLPDAEPSTGEPLKATELVEAIEATSSAAAATRVEFTALAGAGQLIPLGAPSGELQSAIALGLEAVVGDQEQLKARYEEQSGLTELLKARETVPTVDGLRAVVKRERELLDELFGAEEALRLQLLEVEDQLRVARVQKAAAEAELSEAIARGARVSTGRARLTELETKIAGLRGVLGPTQAEAEVTTEAIELLGEVATALKARFAPGIARYIELVLPRITDGRYSRSQISDDLEIRIYSSERGDFVRLIELSLGTADQVLVSLRLGLARALLSSRGIRGGHFLFMDEPLVSADESREQAFFDLLRTFDEEFAQIFVTSPRKLSQDGPFASQFTLTRDAKSLRLVEASSV